jgi:hypothetical protein
VGDSPAAYCDAIICVHITTVIHFFGPVLGASSRNVKEEEKKKMKKQSSSYYKGEEEERKKKNRMDKSQWGPALWRSLHTISMAYPDSPSEKDRKSYGRFFADLGDVIPCEECASNYREHLKAIPVEQGLENGNALFEWSVRLHNAVNEKIGKRSDWTTEQAMAVLEETGWGGGRPDSSSSSSSRGQLLLGALLVALLSVVILAMALRGRWRGEAFTFRAMKQQQQQQQQPQPQRKKRYKN